MAESTFKKGSSDLFLEYLNKYKDEVRSKNTDEFYHVNVVADAYKQGFSDGTKSAEKDFMQQLIQSRLDDFIKKAQQVYILSSELISFLKEKGFSAEAMYICPSFSSPKSIIVVSEELVLNDEFNQTVYPKIYDFRKVFATVLLRCFRYQYYWK